MNKKTIALLLALVLAVSLCACGRRKAAQSETAQDEAVKAEAAETETAAEAAAETGETEPADQAAPESDAIATPAPTLNWVENDDGSMTATIDNGNGGTATVTMGVVEGENFDDLDDPAIGSAPIESTPAPDADSDTPASTPTTAPASTNAPAPTTAPASTNAPAPTTAPAEDIGTVTAPNYVGPDTSTTLAEYEAMSGTEQTLFYYSFATADDFLAWYNAAKAADDAQKNYIEIGENGIVNAG